MERENAIVLGKIHKEIKKGDRPPSLFIIYILLKNKHFIDICQIFTIEGHIGGYENGGGEGE